MDFFDNWTVQVRKGLLELFILNLLQEGELYGYDIIRNVLEVPGFGITEGTLYPLLSRLRMQGLVDTRLVESNEGPARKYYALTPLGKKTAASMNTHFVHILAGLKTTQPKDPR
jgi:PadR family transcriptional regulator PadR